jgi:hypothetical protein
VHASGRRLLPSLGAVTAREAARRRCLAGASRRRQGHASLGHGRPQHVVDLALGTAAAAAPLPPWPLAPLCATAACHCSRVSRSSCCAHPGSARRHVRVLAGRPVCCARLPPCLGVRPGVPHLVRVSSSYRSEATRPLTSLSSHAALFASPRWSAAVGGAASASCCLRAVLHCSVPSRRPHLGLGCSPPSSNFGVCQQRAFRPSSTRS